jgi:hypothetical protein
MLSLQGRVLIELRKAICCLHRMTPKNQLWVVSDK